MSIQLVFLLQIPYLTKNTYLFLTSLSILLT